MDLSDIRKYVRFLGLLAITSIVLRVFWVLDVIFQVEKAVRDSHHQTDTSDTPAGDPSDTNIDTNNGDNSNDNNDTIATTPVLSQKTVLTFGIQVN